MLAGFGSGTVALGGIGLSGLLADYPWGEIGTAGQTLVDIGGGVGTLLLPLLRASPGLRGVLQDLPPTIELAKANFAQNLPNALQEDRIEFEPRDLFTPQRKRGDGYFFVMRWILHDVSCHDRPRLFFAQASALTALHC